MSKTGNSNCFQTSGERNARGLSLSGNPQVQLEHLWDAYIHDPAKQAMACASYCQQQAPHLAEWLKAKILAGIPDKELLARIQPPVTDGRILAYNQLCALTQPAPTAPTQPTPTTQFERAGRTNNPLTLFEHNYHQIFGVVPTVTPEVPPEIRVEPELGRAAIALHKAAEYRLYIIAREITRAGDGSGKVPRKVLKQWLRGYGIHYVREHLSRLLKAGEGLFWNRSRRHLYVRNPAHVAAGMAQIEPMVFATNKPGTRDMYLSPSGGLEQWEATLYAGWLAHRENPTIARETLVALFNRSADTLRLWEGKHLGDRLQVRANYAQCPHPNLEDDRYTDHIPDHSQAYRGFVRFQGEWAEVTRLYWRTCNTYQIKGIRQHPRLGQARSVRKRLNGMLDQPAEEKRGGRPRCKRYFETAEGVKRYVDKHGGAYYLWRGENRKWRASSN